MVFLIKPGVIPPPQFWGTVGSSSPPQGSSWQSPACSNCPGTRLCVSCLFWSGCHSEQEPGREHRRDLLRRELHNQRREELGVEKEAKRLFSFDFEEALTALQKRSSVTQYRNKPNQGRHTFAQHMKLIYFYFYCFN